MSGNFTHEELLKQALAPKLHRNAEIYKKAIKGARHVDLAKEYGIDSSRISRIVQLVERKLTTVGYSGAKKGGKNE